MPVGPVPDRSTVANDDGLVNAAWKEFFKSIFAGLFGWARSYTKTSTIDFANIVAGGELTSAVSVPGARQGDAVIVSPKTKVVGLGCDGNVSASDIVTVRRFNYSLGAIDPVSDDFRIVVLQQ